MAESPLVNSDSRLDGNYVLNILTHISDLNDSLLANEMECYKGIYHQNAEGLANDCPKDWDSLLCWPRTPAGTLVKLSCFDQLYGIRYDSSQNASRWCWPNGTWDNYTDYSHCHELRLPGIESGVEITTMLYFVGYSLSLSTLIVAVAIFLYYKELRCLRNNIHTNLMFSYILADLMWILTTVMQVSMQSDIPTCITFFSLLHYFHLTNFFWMFVEGLYLYLLVVKTFTGDNIKLRLCLVIGWGLPAGVIAIWIIARSTGDYGTESSNQNVALYRHCPWMVHHLYDWFHQAPAIIVLSTNVIFLFMIMWVLITKLRSANNVETQQYRKASKALLVLIPLLGVTYVLVIAGPTEGGVANIFSYSRAILLSLQGFSVTLFYCFLNSEVQNTLRHHFSRWSANRSVGVDRKYYNWSPRSRTESIRLYYQPSVPYRKRESTVSETTTTTVVGVNCAPAFLDRSKHVISEDLNE